MKCEVAFYTSYQEELFRSEVCSEYTKYIVTIVCIDNELQVAQACYWLLTGRDYAGNDVAVAIHSSCPRRTVLRLKRAETTV